MRKLMLKKATTKVDRIKAKFNYQPNQPKTKSETVSKSKVGNATFMKIETGTSELSLNADLFDKKGQAKQ